MNRVGIALKTRLWLLTPKVEPCPGMPRPTAVWLLLKGLQVLSLPEKQVDSSGMTLVCHLVQGCGPTPNGRLLYLGGSEPHSSTSEYRIPTIPIIHAYDPFYFTQTKGQLTRPRLRKAVWWPWLGQRSILWPQGIRFSNLGLSFLICTVK